MVEQLEPPQNLLLAAAKQRDDLVGTEKTMPVNEPDDFLVAFRQFNRGSCGNTFEAGKAEIHSSTLSDTAQMEKAFRLVLCGILNNHEESAKVIHTPILQK